MQKCLKLLNKTGKTSRFPIVKISSIYKKVNRSFCKRVEENLQIDNKVSSNLDNTSSEVNQRISINLNNIQGTRVSDSGYMVASFVCKKCETRNTKKFSKRSYKEGIVIIRCDGCQNLHLIADNLGWFEDTSVNIEDLMRRKGEEIRKISCDGLFQLVSENVKV